MKRVVLCLVGILISLLALSSCTTTRDFYGLKLIDNWQAKGVSSEALMAFLEQDKTNEHDVAGYNAPADRTLEELVNSGYMCANFAVGLHNNAEKSGIRCAIAVNPEIAHAFNAFNTTDKGLVYVDASTGMDSFTYWQDGILVADSEIREGIGISAQHFLGDPKLFKVEW